MNESAITTVIGESIMDTDQEEMFNRKRKSQDVVSSVQGKIAKTDNPPKKQDINCPFCTEPFNDTTIVLHMTMVHDFDVQQPLDSINCMRSKTEIEITVGKSLCKVCGLMLKIGADIPMELHLEKEHAIRKTSAASKLECKVCKVNFPKDYDLQSHFKVFHLKKIGCDTCQLLFPNEKFLNQHIEMEKERDKGVDTFRYFEKELSCCLCSICGKDFGTKAELLDHMKFHGDPSAEKRFLCVNCHVTFSSETYLYVHINVFHSARNRAKCKSCAWVAPAKFVAKHFEKRHKGGERDYVYFETCNICGIAIIDETMIKEHYDKSHNEGRITRKYKCHKCCKMFGAFENLRRHTLLCEKIKMSTYCFVCKKLVPNLHFLEHLKHSHNETKGNHIDAVKCSLCTFTFKRSGSLAMHNKYWHATKEKDQQTSSTTTPVTKSNEANNSPSSTKAKNISVPCTCFRCKISFTNVHDLEIHCQKEHSNEFQSKDDMKACKHCPSKFKNSESLQSHINHCHQQPYKECPACLTARKIGLDALEIHFQQDHLELYTKRSICQICKKSICTSLLTYHMEKSHRVKVKREMEEPIDKMRPDSNRDAKSAKVIEIIDSDSDSETNSPSTNNAFSSNENDTDKISNSPKVSSVHKSNNVNSTEKGTTNVTDPTPPKLKRAYFSCNDCNEQFLRYSDWSEHIKEVHLTKDNAEVDDECFICLKNVGRTMMPQHLIIRHDEFGNNGEDNIQCVLCDKKFKLVGNYKSHLELLHKTKIFVSTTQGCEHLCPVCKANVEKDLKLHISETHGDDIIGKFKCTDCDWRFEYVENLEAHEEAFHESEVIHCKVCYDEKPPIALKYHLDLEHNEDDEKQTIISCRQCKLSFATESNFENHNQSWPWHSNIFVKSLDRVHIVRCEICHISFHTDSELKDHEEQDHKEGSDPDAVGEDNDFILPDLDSNPKRHNKDTSKNDAKVKDSNKNSTSEESSKNDNDVDATEEHTSDNMNSSATNKQDTPESNHESTKGKDEGERSSTENDSLKPKNNLNSTMIDNNSTPKADNVANENDKKQIESNNDNNLEHSSFKTNELHSKKTDIPSQSNPTSKYEVKFQCELCSMKLTIKDMERHYPQHHPETSKDLRNCYVCFTLIPKYVVVPHLEIVHGEIKSGGPCNYICDECSCPFTLFSNFQMHASQAHKRAVQGIFQKGCPICDINMHSWDYDEHLKLKHGEVSNAQNYTCNFCNLGFQKINNLIMHLTKKHASGLSSTLCKVCTRSNLNAIMKYHLIEEHGEDCDKIEKFQCKVCGDKFVNQENCVRHHELWHAKGQMFQDPDDTNLHFVKKLDTTLIGQSNVTNSNKSQLKKPCSVCDQTIELESYGNHMVIEHNEQKNGIKQYSCDFCYIEYQKIQNLTEHLKRYHRAQLAIVSCKVCSKSTVNAVLKYHLSKEHLEDITQKAKFKCKICAEFFVREGNCVTHYKSCHNGKSKDYTKFMENLLDNQKKTHNNNEVTVIDVEEAEDSTESKDKKRKTETKDEASISLPNSNAPYRCEVCEKDFVLLLTLLLHSKKMHNVEIKASSCKVCRKIVLSSKLKEHLEEEHNESSNQNPRYICQTCSKTFIRPVSYQYHIKNWHEKKGNVSQPNKNLEESQEIFDCEFCNSCFHDFESMEKHCRRHHASKIKTVFCQICDKTCLNINIDQHLKTFHSDFLQEGSIEKLTNLNKCHVCNEKFMLKNSLEEHIKLRHSIEPKNKVIQSINENTIKSATRPVTTAATATTYKCYFCDKHYSKISELEGHQKEAHLKALKDVFCKVCMQCPSLKTLKDHLKDEHEEDENCKKSFRCSVCLTMFASKKNCAIHITSWHKIGVTKKNEDAQKGNDVLTVHPFASNSVNKENDLSVVRSPTRQHCAVISEAKKKETMMIQDISYLCSECNKSFTSAAAFQAHCKEHKQVSQSTSEVTEITNPNSKVAEITLPTSRMTQATKTTSRVTEITNPNSRVTESKIPASRIPQAMNPVTRVTGMTNTSSRVTENTLPTSRATLATRPAPRVMETTNPVTRLAEMMKPASKPTDATKPISKVIGIAKPVILTERSSRVKRTAPCKVCAVNVIDDSMTMNIHLMKEHKEYIDKPRPYVCQTCNQSFVVKENCLIHLYNWHMNKVNGKIESPAHNNMNKTNGSNDKLVQNNMNKANGINKGLVQNNKPSGNTERLVHNNVNSSNGSVNNLNVINNPNVSMNNLNGNNQKIVHNMNKPNGNINNPNVNMNNPNGNNERLVQNNMNKSIGNNGTHAQNNSKKDEQTLTLSLTGSNMNGDTSIINLDNVVFVTDAGPLDNGNLSDTVRKTSTASANTTDNGNDVQILSSPSQLKKVAPVQSKQNTNENNLLELEPNCEYRFEDIFNTE